MFFGLENYTRLHLFYMLTRVIIRYGGENQRSRPLVVKIGRLKGMHVVNNY